MRVIASLLLVLNLHAAPPPELTPQQLTGCRELYGHLTEGNHVTAGDFSPRGPFLEFTKAHEIDWKRVTPDERVAAFGRYFVGAAQAVTDPVRLARGQEEALARALARHGAAETRTSARERLTALSKENRTRLRGKGYVSTPEMAEAERLVKDLELRVRHNTASAASIPGTPLLSSHQLEKLGLGGGANTRAFGRDYMHGDDQIYFWTDFSPRAKQTSASASIRDEYGEHELDVSDSYVRQQGWVSIYAMYPSHLLRFSREQFPDIHAAVAATKPGPYAWNEDTLLAQHGDKLAKVRESLHKFDFTVEDFEAAAKEQMLMELDRLRRHGDPAYPRLLTKLASAKRPDRDEVWDALVSGPWKINSRLEVKIPVAVPETQFTRRKL